MSTPILKFAFKEIYLNLPVVYTEWPKITNVSRDHLIHCKIIIIMRYFTGIPTVYQVHRYKTKNILDKNPQP